MNANDRDARTISDVIEVLHYGEDAAGTDRRGRLIRTYSDGRVEYDLHSRECYSYGRHFPLFRYVPRALRARGLPDLFVINGDAWRQQGPTRTPAHQEATRAKIALCSSADTITLPFSAITGAGIDLDSIRPIHVRPDANWTETREARTLVELPRWAREETYPVEHEARTLAELPADGRSHYREDRETGRYVTGERYPDDDGLYRWTETRSRTISPDDDGLYRWTVNVHRLGDALFSAVRAIGETRAADPFEHERDTARESVALRDSDGRSYCTSDEADRNETRAHEAGPSGACIYCGLELRAAVVWRRRARYLSSFDTNEFPPLYFLAEVPRNAGETVETALDALAPRAVHAAIARGRHVARQGDIFFIDTDLTREDLAERGATFARLTQWTRDARAKRGEVGYIEPQTRAQAARELRHARKLWRERFRANVARAVARDRGAIDRETARAEARAAWRELLERQASELDTARETGAALDAPESSPCLNVGERASGSYRFEGCGAEIGEPCRAQTSEDDSAQLALGECRAIPNGYRKPILERHEREREELRGTTDRPAPFEYGAPSTGAGSRRRWRTLRERHANEIASARASLRRATLAGPVRSSSGRVAYPYHGETARDAARRERVSRIERARQDLERTLARGVRDSNENTSARHGRDSYRRGYGDNARSYWIGALQSARERFRPLDTFGTPAHASRRERVRQALAVYGTAHSATETATIRGAVYVRGTVRHVPDLEPGRDGTRDHRDLTLTDGRWYLAVRNTVPRQTRRRRRRNGRASDTR